MWQTFDTHHLRLGAAQARLSWAEVVSADEYDEFTSRVTCSTELLSRGAHVP